MILGGIIIDSIDSIMYIYSGSGLISILRPLLLPSRYYLCVSLPRQYINYLTTTIYATGISNNPSNIFFLPLLLISLYDLWEPVSSAPGYRPRHRDLSLRPPRRL